MSNLDSVLREERVFPPSEEFRSHANLKSQEEFNALYRQSIDDPDTFWSKVAHELDWFSPWDRVLDWKFPIAQWFVGGKTNISHNCLDRHLTGARKNKAAIIWEGEPGDTRTLTYQQLHHEVCRFANVIKKLGVQSGDCVGIYMPMTPEAIIAMLACARIGAIHNVVFGGFSAEAVADRMNDAKAKLIVTADGGFRRGAIIELKDAVDTALKKVPTVENVVVVRRTHNKVVMQPGRDYWWDDLVEEVDANCPAVALDAEHPLFILYTSGTTGRPKGVVHTTGGYMVGTYLTSRYVFDLQEQDTFWCTADVGWITGHSYICYGPLLNGASVVLYEGAPNHPQPDRFWEIIDRHKVSIFYTAPTAIRAFVRWGDEWPAKHDLSSLRLLGTVGEPINPEAWMWYHKVIGKEKCPIVDTWWQTETGAIMISPVPGVTPTKPGSGTLPFFGVDPDIVDKEGNSVGSEGGGLLIIRKPWPSMFRTLYGDKERYVSNYWSQFPNAYFTGDGARRDADGYYWIMGRVDDVINVSGHRLGTAEVESALVSHPLVAEAAVVGRPDELKGQAIVAFVTLQLGVEGNKELEETLRQHVKHEIGALARPEAIRFTDALPKTRSGKIMRRLLKDIASGKETVGDTTTLEDTSVLDKLRLQDEE
jgi:acetyl-CoA synthetase